MNATATLPVQASDLAWRQTDVTLGNCTSILWKHHSAKAEYLIHFFTDLANTLISERVGNATGGCDVMDLILTNKDETEVMEIVLTGCANAILGSLVMKNMLATVRYMKLDII